MEGYHIFYSDQKGSYLIFIIVLVEIILPLIIVNSGISLKVTAKGELCWGVGGLGGDLELSSPSLQIWFIMSTDCPTVLKSSS